MEETLVFVQNVQNTAKTVQKMLQIAPNASLVLVSISTALDTQKDANRALNTAIVASVLTDASNAHTDMAMNSSEMIQMAVARNVQKTATTATLITENANFASMTMELTRVQIYARNAPMNIVQTVQRTSMFAFHVKEIEVSIQVAAKRSVLLVLMDVSVTARINFA